MSLRRPTKDQPESFEFNQASLEAANNIVEKYPEGKQQSAVMALLYIAQKHCKVCFVYISRNILIILLTFIRIGYHWQQ